MSTTVDEQAILESLHRVPAGRWDEILRFIDSLSEAGPAIRTGEDLMRSGLVGLWSDRDDLGDGHEFARGLRRQAEARRGADDAAGH